jgi:F-type H+-transporting ATPase subunit b
MRIDWWTLALQAANFLVLVWLLQHFLYRPVLGIIAERQQRTDGVIAEANAARGAAEGLRAEVEQQRGAIAKERDQALEQAHARAKQDAATLIERARADAEKLLADERQRIEQERREAVEALRRAAIELAVTIARRLLADATEASVDGRLLDRAIARLQALPEPERQQLLDQLVDGEVVRVVTAAPLDTAASEDVVRRLQELLRRQIDVEFACDPALIAGVELHFPHTVLYHSWRDSLREIEEELKRDGGPAGHA